MKPNKDIFYWITFSALAALSFYRDKKVGFFTTKLSQFFTWDEVEHSAYAQSHGINNSLPESLRQNAWMFANYILDPIRQSMNRTIYVNSWYRSPQLNAAIGGADHSDHMNALAADIDLKTGNDNDNAQIIATALELNLPFDKIIAYDNPGKPSRVHISYRAGSIPRKKIMYYINGQYHVMSLDQAMTYYSV